jgi:hypothetical protein
MWQGNIRNALENLGFEANDGFCMQYKRKNADGKVDNVRVYISSKGELRATLTLDRNAEDIIRLLMECRG